MRFYLPIAIIAFAVSAYAAFSFLGEYRAARLSMATDTAVFQTLVNAPPARPGSLYADKNIFMACHEALTGRIAKLQPEAVLKEISAFCRLQAEAGLGSAPSSALAHYTLALAAWISGDTDVANRELLSSQENGRFESWLAKRRFKLALRLGDSLAGDGQTALDADITALLQSRKGRVFLARYYAVRPSLKDRMINLADGLGEDVQAALLKEIGKVLKARAGGA